MKMNPELLKLARLSLGNNGHDKQAFVPAAQMAGAGMPPGGAPPMDPAMDL